jgi:hypothetical protein
MPRFVGRVGTASNMMRISLDDSDTDLVAAFKKELGSRAVKQGNYYYMIGGMQNSCSEAGAAKGNVIANSLRSEFLQLTAN